MLSRVANSIYWLSRYMERAENVARFIDVNLQMMLDLPSGSNQQWRPLVSISGDDAVFASRYAVASRENVIKFLALDAENPNSIISCLRMARENSRTVREAISSEMWEQVNTIRKLDVAIVVVEQNTRRTLTNADWAYVMTLGRNRLSGPGRELLQDPEIVDLYIGKEA